MSLGRRILALAVIRRQRFAWCPMVWSRRWQPATIFAIFVQQLEASFSNRKNGSLCFFLVEFLGVNMKLTKNDRNHGILDYLTLDKDDKKSQNQRVFQVFQVTSLTSGSVRLSWSVLPEVRGSEST